MSEQENTPEIKREPLTDLQQERSLQLDLRAHELQLVQRTMAESMMQMRTALKGVVSSMNDMATMLLVIAKKAGGSMKEEISEVDRIEQEMMRKQVILEEAVTACYDQMMKTV